MSHGTHRRTHRERRWADFHWWPCGGGPRLSSMCYMTQCVWYGSSRVTWLLTCDITHRRRSFAGGPSWSCICHMIQRVWHDSLSVSLLCTCDMTHWYVWHDLFIYVTRLIHVCVMTHSYVYHYSVLVTWLTVDDHLVEDQGCFPRVTWLHVTQNSSLMII